MSKLRTLIFTLAYLQNDCGILGLFNATLMIIRFSDCRMCNQINAFNFEITTNLIDLYVLQTEFMIRSTALTILEQDADPIFPISRSGRTTEVIPLSNEHLTDYVDFCRKYLFILA